MNINTLGVVILNWNNAIDTIACVRNIVDTWQAQPNEIVVVDNHSTYNDLAVLKSAQLPIRLIENKNNLGFGGGTNKGIVAMYEAHCEFILLLNNDARISSDDVQSLLITLVSSKDVAVVGPLLYDDDTLLAAGGRNIAFYTDTHLHKPRHSNKPYDVTYVSGTVMLLKREVIDIVGLLDERYFFSGEIADFCFRIHKANYRCVINPLSLAYHMMDRSAPLRSTVYQYYSLRNRFLFIQKFYLFRQFIYGSFWILYGILKTLISLLKRDRAQARCIWMGLLDGLIGVYGNQNQRIAGIE